MQKIKLPLIIAGMVHARDRLRRHYTRVLTTKSATAILNFTFDGRFIGDIGEALAAEVFGMRLEQGQGTDGFAPSGHSVQVKATNCGLGPTFRQLAFHADHLICFDLDLNKCEAQIVCNGPEKLVRDLLPVDFKGQRQVRMSRLIELNKSIADEDRLPIIRSAA